MTGKNCTGRIRLNKRVILITLLLLTLVDVGIRLYVQHHLATEVRRLPADDRGTLYAFRDSLKKSQAARIVFVGDSVVHGGGVPEEDETIPAYFDYLLRREFGDEFRVFNFSLPGATPGDVEAIVRYIGSTHPDLIVYDLNLGWFGDPKPMEHPGLKGMPGRAGEGPWEDRLSQAVEEAWGLYRYRILLSYWWFGQPLPDKFREAIKRHDPAYLLPGAENCTPEKMEQYRPWRQKDWKALATKRGRVGEVSLDASNPHYQAYQRLLSYARSQGIPMAVFMVPRNDMLYTQYDLVNRPALTVCQAKLARIALDNRAVVFDYTWRIPDNEFVDLVHLTAQGNSLVAHLLFRDLELSGLLGEKV